MLALELGTIAFLQAVAIIVLGFLLFTTKIKLARFAKIEDAEQHLAGIREQATELKLTAESYAKEIAKGKVVYVYVLSNIGTMGKNRYKIGMTRRLEPLVRVAELGDASVPFPFDVHAMIFCEDAPALENALHQQFNDRRVNMVNLRKEYFDISLDEIREAVAKNHGLVTFLLEPPADQYRETLAIKAENVQAAVA